MNQETIDKVLEDHSEKLMRYSDEIHATVDKILADDCSMNDVIGLLEVEKMFRYNQGASAARCNALLERLLGDECDKEGEE